MEITDVVGSFGLYQILVLALVLVASFPVTFHLRPLTRLLAQRHFNELFYLPDNSTFNESVTPVFYGFDSLNDDNGYWSQNRAEAVGGIIGCIFLGIIADRWGRRPFLTTSVIWTLAFSTAKCFLPNEESFQWLHSLFGILQAIGSGGLYCILLVLYVECVGYRHRPLWTFIEALGASGAASIYIYLKHHSINSFYVHLGAALFTALALPYLYFVEESPKWLISTGHIQRAERGLLRIQRTNRRPILYMNVVMPELADKITDSQRYQHCKKIFSCQPLRKTIATIVLFSFATALLHTSLKSRCLNVAGNGSVVLWGFLDPMVHFAAGVFSAILLSCWPTRRSPISLAYLLLLIAHIAIYFVAEGDNIMLVVFEQLIHFGSMSIFLLLVMFINEVVPTRSRATYVGLTMAAYLAGILVVAALFHAVPGTSLFFAVGSAWRSLLALSCSVGAFMGLPSKPSRFSLPDTIAQADRIVSRRLSSVVELKHCTRSTRT